MTRVTWDGPDRTYSQGISQGVLYPKNSSGVAWNGLISVTEKGDDNTTSVVIDGQIATAENLPGVFSGTISAYMYPDELEPCVGIVNGLTSQPRQSFGLSYLDNQQLHLVYNVKLDPGSDQYVTLSGSPTPLAFSWNFTTTPMAIPWGRPAAHLVIMLENAASGAISDLENLIYGDTANAPSLPDPLAVYNVFDPYAIVRIVDNGDGSWTATGPDANVYLTDSETFTIDWPTAIMISTDEYTIHSL